MVEMRVEMFKNIRTITVERGVLIGMIVFCVVPELME